MSDNYLHLIPSDPAYIPSRAHIEAAISVLSMIWPHVAPDAVISDEIEFVSPAGNFEHVSCPCCGTMLDVAWWADAMQGAYEASHFLDRAIQTPCCRCLTDLTELHYSWPAGFARFVVTLAHPGGDLNGAQLCLVSEALGADLHKVWAHC